MRRIVATTLGMVFVLAAGVPLRAGVTLESRAEPTTIRIGDVITYTITVTHDESTEIRLPSPGENLGAFEIRDFQPFRARKFEGQVREEAQFLISTFDVGEFVIPPIRVLYRTKGDSSWQEIHSQPITITVESLNPDEAGDIRDIKPPVVMPYDWHRLLYWILLGVVVAGAAVAGYIFYRRWRRGEALLPTRAAPQRPANEVALEQLDALYNSDLLERGEIKLLHVRLSEIVREYIENRFEVPALEMTTAEIMSAFEDGRLPEASRETLQEFLDACDLVKFAKYQPTREEIERAFELAYRFVDETKPVVEEPRVLEGVEEVSEKTPVAESGPEEVD